MSWDYPDDPRPDVQALVPGGVSRVLDVGCGGGALAAALKARGVPHIAGVERHPQAVLRARDRVDALVEGDLLEVALPFAPGEFELIIFADVLEHLPDPEAALRRYLPYLAPQGRLLASVPNHRFYLVLLRLLCDRWAYTDSGIRDRTHLRIFTRRSLLGLLETCGLRLESLRRNFRLFEDQSRMGRPGALLTRLAAASLGRLLPDLMAFQYLVLARRASP